MRRDLCLGGSLVLVSCLLAPAVAKEPPAAAIATKMATVTDELNRSETGATVQKEQKGIVRDLDELIASLEKKIEANRGGIKQNRAIRGMADSMISGGTGGIGTLLNPDDVGKDWGKLSSRERDRILQSMSEGFPPEYRTVLERYYRRLADEKGPAAAPEGKAGTAAKPAAAKP